VLSAGTANGVTYLNGSKSLTSGAAITFDGTNFATTGTATAAKLIPTGTSVTGNGLYLPAANALGLSTNGTNAVYIDASQNVGIGTTSTTQNKVRLDSNCNTLTALEVRDQGTTGGTFISFYNSAGNGCGGVVHNGTTTVNYSTSSDYRMKEDVQPMTGALSKIALLKPVTYKWKEKFGGESGQGFIAHELQAVVPDCVSGDKDATRQEEYEVTPAVKDEEGIITTPAAMGTRTVPVYQGIDASFLVATLTAAIQELKAEFDAYKASHP
jgi:hypothetical protein